MHVMHVAARMHANAEARLWHGCTCCSQAYGHGMALAWCCRASLGWIVACSA